MMLLFAPLRLLAQDCEGVIALSKRKDVILISKNSLERHAGIFCSTYDRKESRESSLRFTTSYHILSASIGISDAPMESIAERFCSATDEHAASAAAYMQYIETISPEGYRAYGQCLRMLQQELRFHVDVNSILPDEFSMSASFVSMTGQASAKVTVASSQDVSCRWKYTDEEVKDIRSGSSAILTCTRQDTTRRSYVNLVRNDIGSGQESLVIPWQPYDQDGISLDTLSTVMQELALIDARLTELHGKYEQLAFETDFIVLRAVNTRPIDDPSLCPTGSQNLRGEIKGRINFSKPFASVPRVTVGFSEINLRGSDVLDMNRLKIVVEEVDRDGFSYSFVTWCSTVVHSATASWIAIGK